MAESLREHLLATIAHLSTRRSALLTEIQRVDEVLQMLTREEESLPRAARLAFPDERREGTYAGISVRWAVLLFLSEYTNGSQPLATIADALRDGGSTTKAQSFNSNVSAVLSQMVAKGEVSKTDAGFALTDHGRVVWQGIKNSEKFLTRNAVGTEGGEPDAADIR